jgi:sterol desaturase/sphingolipid hydroxylase (fatty acid hydroxylase superfamily)
MIRSPIRVSTLLAIGFVGTLLWAERRRPLRSPVEPGTHRLIRNGVLAGLAGIAVFLAERPIVDPLAQHVQRRRFGLMQYLPLPTVWRDTLAVVLMDYTLYIWHVLMHRWSPLYRLHQVHHADLDLDLTTALRFHVGEMLASVPWRAAQVVFLGVSPRALTLWQRLTMASILFHHSNTRLPPGLERRLGWLIATPRLHGIHHSVVREEQDSNWSNGLTLWDRLHGTYRADPPQRDLEIGSACHRERNEVTFLKMLQLPGVRPGEAHRLPNGRIVRRC